MRQTFLVLAMLSCVAAYPQSVSFPSRNKDSTKGAFAVSGYGMKYFQPDSRAPMIELGYEYITRDNFLLTAVYHGGMSKQKGIMGVRLCAGYSVKGVSAFAGYLFQVQDTDIKDPNNVDRPVYGISFTNWRPVGIGFLYASLVRTMPRPGQGVEGSTFVTIGVKLGLKSHSEY